MRILFLILSLVVSNFTLAAEERQTVQFFETEIRPLLAAKCYDCHGEKKQKGGLRVDGLERLLKGGSSGPALIAGDPDKSLLIDAVRRTDPDLEMPPKKALPASDVAKLEKWIAMGAPWPSAGSPRKTEQFSDEDREWWAIQPVKEPDIPAGANDWARNPIDRFVARKLKAAGLKPAAEADRSELVRRAYFDLHGLPPTSEQVAAFVKDDRTDAWPRLIKKLLESPRYGERWAQHWLDVVRYADSDGYNEDAFRPSASAFRDYVIRSLNDDKPYNQFVREHLAGDEIDPGNPDVFIGTAYLRHGVYEWNQRNARMHWDLIINEMTRVTGEAFLGIGIGCAQCHDHKFDPILQKDYFGLQAFLSSVKWPLETPLATPEQVAAYDKKRKTWEEKTQTIRDEMHNLAKASFDGNQKYTIEQFPDDVQAIYHKSEAEKTTYEKQISYLVERQRKRAEDRYDYPKALKSKPDKLKRYKELQGELKKFDSIKPKPLPDGFVATDYGTKPAQTFLLTRTTKVAIEPAFLALLGGKPNITPTRKTTGRRMALADWITRADNPLTTRVIVNRVWQRHFGKGIVPTPNDFGTLGEPPSHPELLDWLTSRFLTGGWRLKSLHELVMNSAAYRQTARFEPSATESRIDPGNRLLWRFPPQRLDAEQVRDAMLAASGELRMREGGAAVTGTSPYRSVFVKKMRNKPDEMLSGFDAPLGFESAPDRVATTTAIQSLLMVNGDWSLARSRAFARRLLSGKSLADPSHIRNAYRIAFGRDAAPDEIRAALGFIKRQADTLPLPAVVTDKYPNETGLRPITQHFRTVKDLGLGKKTLWLQPGSRFERLRAKQAEKLGDEFTVEAVTILDRVYPDASVNTLFSRWTGSTKTPGWNIGITSARSGYQPRNFIVQFVGRTFQDEPKYEVVASGLRFPLGKPVYIAAAISAIASKKNPTSGTVTFYMKDLTDPKAKLQSAVVETAIVNGIQNSALPAVIGGRTGLNHQWDGQLARLKVSQGVLTKDQLLIGGDAAKTPKVLDWVFNGDDGERVAAETAWLRATTKGKSGVPDRTLHGVTAFCQALFNSNEFLYLH